MKVMEARMDATQLVPVIVAITALVALGLAAVGFGADTRDSQGPATRR
jgi:hypothetical protein